jgi:hypothetical protein
VAPLSLTLPHKGGGNGKLRAERQAMLRRHDTPPIRNSLASIPSGA